MAARLETKTQNQARFGVSYWPVFLLESQEFPRLLRPEALPAG